MKSDNDIPPLEKEEFEIFLLIYAAHVDYEFTQEEKDFIRKRTDEATFSRMNQLFMERGDFANLQIILKHTKKYYKTEKQREDLFLLLRQAFKADGEFSRVEKVFVTFFKRMARIY